MKSFVMLLLIIGEIVIGFAAKGEEVIGYYAGWKWYRRDKLVNPATIPYHRYTIINYAFFKPVSSGEILNGDDYADDIILLGEKSHAGGRINSTSLVYNAHQAGVKVLASVGGGTWSQSFTGIAESIHKRKIFASACVKLVSTYGFDGIDIDWEFPGSNENKNDTRNFTLLVEEVRSAFDAYTLRYGKKLYLTAAFGPAPKHMHVIEWDRVAPKLNFINLMTYNYHGAWDATSSHHTPLFGNKKNDV